MRQNINNKQRFDKCPWGSETLTAWQGAAVGGEVPPGLPLTLHHTGSPERAQVEDYIAAVFARHYGARIRHFKPHLLAMHGEDGRILAALGLRSAASGPLFLETYLDLPVEQRLSAVCGQGVRRGDIVEVGNLASRHPAGHAACSAC